MEATLILSLSFFFFFFFFLSKQSPCVRDVINFQTTESQTLLFFSDSYMKCEENG